jgi:hypothetical protein
MNRFRRVSILALSLCTYSLAGALAASIALDDFAEANKSEMEKQFPFVTSVFPNGRFLISGFSAPSGDWRVIRVEGTEYCENSICPTIVYHSKTEWKIFVKAERKIEASFTVTHGESVEIFLNVNQGDRLVVKYSNGEKVIGFFPKQQ